MLIYCLLFAIVGVCSLCFAYCFLVYFKQIYNNLHLAIFSLSELDVMFTFPQLLFMHYVTLLVYARKTGRRASETWCVLAVACLASWTTLSFDSNQHYIMSYGLQEQAFVVLVCAYLEHKLQIIFITMDIIHILKYFAVPFIPLVHSMLQMLGYFILLGSLNNNAGFRSKFDVLMMNILLQAFFILIGSRLNIVVLVSVYVSAVFIVPFVLKQIIVYEQRHINRSASIFEAIMASFDNYATMSCIVITISSITLIALITFVGRVFGLFGFFTLIVIASTFIGSMGLLYVIYTKRHVLTQYTLGYHYSACCFDYNWLHDHLLSYDSDRTISICVC